MALSNITLGQYYPADSAVHRMDPRVKIVLLIALIVAIFLANNLLAFVPVVIFLVAATKLAKVPLKLMVKGLKPLDGAPHGSLRAFCLEAGEKKYMILAFDYSLTGELLQPEGEVTFSLPEEMKDTAFTTVDTEGEERPAEKTSENGVWTLKVDFTPEDKDPVKVMILSVAD